MKYVSYLWRILLALVYVVVAIGVVSSATTKFETLVLAGLVELYAVAIYNFTILGTTADANNYAEFVRFQTVANAQGVTEIDGVPLSELDEVMAEGINSYRIPVRIRLLANWVVGVYALLKIGQAVLFG